MPTLLELRAKVRARGNFRTTDTQLTDSVLTGFINDALAQVTMEHDWPWLQTTETINTIAGQSFYLYATASPFYKRTKSLTFNDTGWPIQLVAIEDIDQLKPFSGRPVAYAVFDDCIRLRPTPTAVYAITHEYYSLEPTLVADGDTTLIPSQYVEGVVEYATHLCFRAIKDSSRAQECILSYREWLKRTTNMVRQFRAPLRVRVRAGAYNV